MDAAATGSRARRGVATLLGASARACQRVARWGFITHGRCRHGDFTGFLGHATLPGAILGLGQRPPSAPAARPTARPASVAYHNEHAYTTRLWPLREESLLYANWATSTSAGARADLCLTCPSRSVHMQSRRALHAAEADLEEDSHPDVAPPGPRRRPGGGDEQRPRTPADLERGVVSGERLWHQEFPGLPHNSVRKQVRLSPGIGGSQRGPPIAEKTLGQARRGHGIDLPAQRILSKRLPPGQHSYASFMPPDSVHVFGPKQRNLTWRWREEGPLLEGSRAADSGRAVASAQGLANLGVGRISPTWRSRLNIYMPKFLAFSDPVAMPINLRTPLGSLQVNRRLEVMHLGAIQASSLDRALVVVPGLKSTSVEMWSFPLSWPWERWLGLMAAWTLLLALPGWLVARRWLRRTA